MPIPFSKLPRLQLASQGDRKTITDRSAFADLIYPNVGVGTKQPQVLKSGALIIQRLGWCRADDRRAQNCTRYA
jgi:hypothetical protein